MRAARMDAADIADKANRNIGNASIRYRETLDIERRQPKDSLHPGLDEEMRVLAGVVEQYQVVGSLSA